MRAIFCIPGLIAIAAIAQAQVTFTKDFTPILHNRCQSCHRPCRQNMCMQAQKAPIETHVRRQHIVMWTYPVANMRGRDRG